VSLIKNDVGTVFNVDHRSVIIFKLASQFLKFTTQQIMNKFGLLKKIGESCLILMRGIRICFQIFPSTSGFEIIFNESSKNTQNVLIEWLWNEITRTFTKTKVYVVSLILSLVFKTVFEIFLAPLVCLKSVK
jgi:hypothetical protein